jgi:hydroxyacylglutathione hydrolase
MMPTDTIVQKFKLGFTCCYLLKCSGGYLLIDTSYPNRFPQFQKCIARSGIDISEIKHLLLTHHHDDHAGFAAELVRASGCRIIAHRNALAPLKNGESMDTMKPVNLRIRCVFSLFMLFHGRFTFPPVELGENDIMVDGDDSDLLKEIGVDGRILYTPGHTNDSISVVMPDGTAIVGDAAMNFLPGSGIRHRPIFVEDIDAVYRSWERLCAQGAKIIFPAHGKPFPARDLVPCR